MLLDCPFIKGDKQPVDKLSREWLDECSRRNIAELQQPSGPPVDTSNLICPKPGARYLEWIYMLSTFQTTASLFENIITCDHKDKQASIGKGILKTESLLWTVLD